MKAYVVTEGKAKEAFLAKLLADEAPREAKIVSAKGKSGAESLARSLVATYCRPVALVLDADTTHEPLVREQRLEARELLAMASPGVPAEVFLAVPCLERLFFTDRAMLERLLDARVEDTVWAVGAYAPRETLERLFRETRTSLRSPSDLLEALTDDDVARLREQPPVSEVLAFLQRLPVPETASK